MPHPFPRFARSTLALLGAAAALLGSTDPVRAGTASSLALVGGTVVGTDSGKEIPNAVVLIEGDRIVKVGAADATPIPEGAKRIAMQGKYLIPGLMNMHVHLGLKLPGAAGDSLVE